MKDDIDVILAYFGCHGTYDNQGEYLSVSKNIFEKKPNFYQLFGKNIRTSRLAQIMTIINKDDELANSLPHVRIVTYINACRNTDEINRLIWRISPFENRLRETERS